MFLTETWLTPEKPNSVFLYDLSHYTAFRSDRTFCRGGGVAIICNSLLCPSLVKSYTQSCSFDIIAVDVPSPSGSLRLICVYLRPACPSSDFKLCFEILSDLCSSNVDCIIGGDFNLPGINWESLSSDNEFGSFLLNFSLSHNLSQIVSNETRKSNILDLIFVNFEIYSLSIGPPIGQSDHNTIQITFNFNIKPLNEDEEIYFPAISKDVKNQLLLE